MALNSTNFRLDVIERSFDVPVVVDFWAEWCGPCKALGPIIEELALESEGRWELVKLNTEDFPEVAQQYKIRSIPALKIFSGGKVISEIVGALPKGQLKQWIESSLPDERQGTLDAILRHFEHSPEEALPVLENFVEDHPDLVEARMKLASFHLWDSPELSVKLVEDQVLGQPHFEEAEDVRVVAGLLTAGVEGEGKLPELLNAARAAAQAGDFDAALQGLVEAVMIDKTFRDDLPRKACIAFFHLLGKQHPLTLKYRRRFDMALY